MLFVLMLFVVVACFPVVVVVEAFSVGGGRPCSGGLQQKLLSTGTTTTTTTTTQLRYRQQHPYDDDNDNEDNDDDRTDAYGHRESEISRRVALVLAAAFAAGTTSTGGGSSVADAAAVNLKNFVASIERENLDGVNANGAPEKHLPRVTATVDPSRPSRTDVEVLVPHVMEVGNGTEEKPQHYIQFIWLKDVNSGRIAAVESFQPTDPSPPTLRANLKTGTTVVKPMLFCNLHGLWEGATVYL